MDCFLLHIALLLLYLGLILLLHFPIHHIDIPLLLFHLILLHLHYLKYLLLIHNFFLYILFHLLHLYHSSILAFLPHCFLLLLFLHLGNTIIFHCSPSFFPIFTLLYHFFINLSISLFF